MRKYLLHVSICIFGALSTSSSTSFDAQLAALLAAGPPSQDALDALSRQVAGTAGYQSATRTDVGLSRPLEMMLLNMAENSAAGLVAQELHVKSGIVKDVFTVGIAAVGEVGRLAFTSPNDVIDTTADGSEMPSFDTSDPADLSIVYSRQAKFMVNSLDPLTSMVANLTRDLPAEVTDENYVSVLKILDDDCNAVLTKLAFDAQIRMASTSQGAADHWRGALIEIHLIVANHVTQQPGAAAWSAFYAELTTSIGALISFAKVARGSATTAISPDATNADLKAAIARNSVDTTVLCWFRCFRNLSCCKPSSMDNVVDPSISFTASDDLIEVALFIDNAIANIEDIAKEVLSHSSRDSETALVNLRLRISLRLMNLIKLAIAHKSLQHMYEVINTKSLIVLAFMQGVQPDSWNTVRKQIQQVLLSIAQVLIDSRPSIDSLTIVAPKTNLLSSTPAPPVRRIPAGGPTGTPPGDMAKPVIRPSVQPAVISMAKQPTAVSLIATIPVEQPQKVSPTVAMPSIAQPPPATIPLGQPQQSSLTVNPVVSQQEALPKQPQPAAQLSSTVFDGWNLMLAPTTENEDSMPELHAKLLLNTMEATHTALTILIKQQRDLLRQPSMTNYLSQAGVGAVPGELTTTTTTTTPETTTRATTTPETTTTTTATTTTTERLAASL